MGHDASNPEQIIDQAIDALALGQPDEAVALLAPLVADAPNNAEAVHALIRALADAGHVEDALTQTRALIELYPEDVLAYTRLSMLLQRAGDIPAAEAASTRAKILGWKHELRSASNAPSDASNEAVTLRVDNTRLP